jgi:hypothetical protein
MIASAVIVPYDKLTKATFKQKRRKSLMSFLVWLSLFTGAGKPIVLSQLQLSPLLTR